ILPKGVLLGGRHASAGGPVCVLWVQALFAWCWPSAGQGVRGGTAVMEEPALTFAGLLRQLRAETRLTQEELAEAAGLSPRSVSDLERALTGPPARRPPRCWQRRLACPRRPQSCSWPQPAGGAPLRTWWRPGGGQL